MWQRGGPHRSQQQNKTMDDDPYMSYLIHICHICLQHKNRIKKNCQKKEITYRPHHVRAVYRGSNSPLIQFYDLNIHKLNKVHSIYSTINKSISC
jgi:hypothetical protein